MEGVFFPRETYAKVVAFMVGRPYGEVARIIREIEATCFEHTVATPDAGNKDTSEAGNGPGV